MRCSQWEGATLLERLREGTGLRVLLSHDSQEEGRRLFGGRAPATPVAWLELGLKNSACPACCRGPERPSLRDSITWRSPSCAVFPCVSRGFYVSFFLALVLQEGQASRQLPLSQPRGQEAQLCPSPWPAGPQAVGSTCPAGAARPSLRPPQALSASRPRSLWAARPPGGCRVEQRDPGCPPFLCWPYQTSLGTRGQAQVSRPGGLASPKAAALWEPQGRRREDSACPRWRASRRGVTGWPVLHGEMGAREMD